MGGDLRPERDGEEIVCFVRVLGADDAGGEMHDAGDAAASNCQGFSFFYR